MVNGLKAKILNILNQLPKLASGQQRNLGLCYQHKKHQKGGIANAKAKGSTATAGKGGVANATATGSTATAKDGGIARAMVSGSIATATDAQSIAIAADEDGAKAFNSAKLEKSNIQDQSGNKFITDDDLDVLV